MNPTFNTFLLAQLTVAYAHWNQAIASLEYAARTLDQDAANVALDVGNRSAVVVSQLTQGNPNQATASRWAAAITAWNNAGFGMTSDPTESPQPFPWWILVGVVAFALASSKR